MIDIPQIPDSKKLSRKIVSVVGLGALGSAVAEQLARIGVNLRVIDRDRVKEGDLSILSLYTLDHLSKFKAKEAKKLLEISNKDIRVKAFHEDLVDHNAYLVEADVVVDCSNDIKTSLLVDKAAKKAPVIYARASGVLGHIFVAQDTRIKHVSNFLATSAPDNKNEGVLCSTIAVTASLVVNKALKLLSNQKVEKNCLHVDTWKYSFDKQPVKKNKK